MKTEQSIDNAATTPEQSAHVAPAKSTAKKSASKKTGTPKAQKAAKAKKAPARAKSAPKASDRTNKKAEVIAMMKRAKGVTLGEIMETTGWQKHTVRGFVSILGSKGGEKIESSKNAAGERGWSNWTIALVEEIDPTSRAVVCLY